MGHVPERLASRMYSQNGFRSMGNSLLSWFINPLDLIIHWFEGMCIAVL